MRIYDSSEIQSNLSSPLNDLKQAKSLIEDNKALIEKYVSLEEALKALKTVIEREEEI